MATATKQATKSKSTKSTKSKSTAKPKATKSSAKPRAKSTAKSAAKKVTPRAPRIEKHIGTAESATALIKSQKVNGKPTSRGPVSTQQVGRVLGVIGRQKASDALTKRLGFASVAQAERSSGKLGKTETLADGVRAKMSEMSSAIGDDNHKIAGRKLTAILVALTK